jgi:tetratricopeptide (TPR) repeat protein
VQWFEALDEWWEESILGPSREWDQCLMARAGAMEFLTRALESRRRNDQAEVGFHRLLAALNEQLPEVFAGRPVAVRAELPGFPSGALAPRPMSAGGKERWQSELLVELARFYERIGEDHKAAITYDIVLDRLDKLGLAENRSSWAVALFARGGVALEQRDAAAAQAALDRYLRYFENHRVDVEQRPDAYGDPESALDYFKSRLSQGFVSLAVLHNVVLHDAATARRHCARAIELDDSPFNRVLYACYLAREGKRDEALRLAGSVEVIPELYYNLACTYALAGRSEEALDWLARDLAENHRTVKKRNGQRDWARQDRDLVSLFEDPRFLDLVRHQEAGK